MDRASCIKGLQRVAVAIVLAALGACAQQPLPMPAAVVPPPTPAPEQPFFAQVGTASWYGGTHQGRKTASGERFDMNAMTAAHRSLKMGTVLRITNLENGRTANVRINDRGPYIYNRVIDLSAAAARQLDMKQNGLAQVRIEAFTSDQPGRATIADIAPLLEPAQ